jgi:hypothetical protein
VAQDFINVFGLAQTLLFIFVQHLNVQNIMAICVDLPLKLGPVHRLTLRFRVYLIEATGLVRSESDCTFSACFGYRMEEFQ